MFKMILACSKIMNSKLYRIFFSCIEGSPPKSKAGLMGVGEGASVGWEDNVNEHCIEFSS